MPRFLDVLLPAGGTHSDSAVLALTIGLVVAISLLMHLQALGSWLLQAYTSEKLVLDFRSQLFRHVQRLSLVYQVD